MRIGVLDIGSNSAQLQVVEAFPGEPPLPAYAIKEPTRLSEAFSEDGSINEAGLDRVVNAVERAVGAARQGSVEQLFAFVTSAVRDAGNRDEVLNRIEEASGIRPHFLAGEDEARLTYLAARRWYGWSAGGLLVLDIGGGSLEIALGRAETPDVSVSLPLGAGRLTRAFLSNHPPSRTEVKALCRHVRDTLREVSDRMRWERPPARVVGTSKTFKQLARLAGASPQRQGPFVPRGLTRKDASAWAVRLAGLSAEQRAKLNGVSTPRSRQILAGAIVARSTMKALGVGRLDVCPWALREGIVLRHLDGDSDLSLQPVELDLTQPPSAKVRRLPRQASDHHYLRASSRGVESGR
ncbi:Ppx/GppA phosphatase family protein [Pseudonocardia acaciae]|uniref:Ppx/GppA phosphatase family protein n=1 Tax=Pseudonocardia acaciae TaxID=551276 RepID=UPI000685A971|nr:Ppx/GppA phosphatase family protein [Pseudonocardia acaciae]